MNSIIRTNRQPIARVLPNAGSARLVRALPADWVVAPSSPELLVNGGLVANLTGWTAYQATTAWVSAGQGAFTKSLAPGVGSKAQLYQSVAVQLGETYRLQIGMSSDNGAAPVRGFVSMSGPVVLVSSPWVTTQAQQRFDLFFQAKASTVNIAWETPDDNAAASTYSVFAASLKRCAPAAHGEQLIADPLFNAPYQQGVWAFVNCTVVQSNGRLSLTAIADGDMVMVCPVSILTGFKHELTAQARNVDCAGGWFCYVDSGSPGFTVFASTPTRSSTVESSELGAWNSAVTDSTSRVVLSGRSALAGQRIEVSTVSVLRGGAV